MQLQKPVIFPVTKDQWLSSGDKPKQKQTFIHLAKNKPCIVLRAFGFWVYWITHFYIHVFLLKRTGFFPFKLIDIICRSFINVYIFFENKKGENSKNVTMG